ncbi:MAG: hypothetical protein H0T89_20580 [Deltaproteobacteria bacterium]|nr:hypothetical protein [Deltaproteobacteria bacterium]MDQ3297581.1 hypothetical protein [Myxococcota bacterium]
MRITRRELYWMGCVVTAASSCAPNVRSVFRATDSTFSPNPGPTPRVYVESNLEEAPRSKMRSVGIIEITVPRSKGMEYAIKAAATKGGELGCWAVIEHGAFAKLQSQASLEFGASVELAHGAHGGAPALHPSSPAKKLSAEFDCVMQAPLGSPT